MKTPLTTNQLVEGIERCIISAHDLYRTASHTDFIPPKAIATALGYLAHEEYGKIGWLFWAVGIPYRRSQKAWKLFWEKYKDHQHKIKIGVMLRHRTTTNSLIPGMEDFFLGNYPIMPAHPSVIKSIRE